MYNEKKMIICFILLPLTMIALICSIFLPKSANRIERINSFAVDSFGRLYLQSDENRDDIWMYENGKYIGTIDLRESLKNAPNGFSSRGSCFTIKRDVLYVATSTYVYQLDLQGNMLDSYKDRSNLHGRISGKRYVADNGDCYLKKNVLFRTSIIKDNGEVIYQISVQAAVLKWMGIISTVLFAVVVTTIVLHYWKERYC